MHPLYSPDQLCHLSVEEVVDLLAADEHLYAKGLRRVTKQSLDRAWDILPATPAVLIEHAWDVSQKGNGDLYMLDDNGDSPDGYVIHYHAVRYLPGIYLRFGWSTFLRPTV